MSTNVVKKGVYLAFVPIQTAIGTVESFELYLVNEDMKDWTYYIDQVVDGDDFFIYEGKLPSNKGIDIALIALYDLKASSIISLHLNNKEEKNKYSFSPKPNKLFKRMQYFPTLDREAYFIEVYTQLAVGTKIKKSVREQEDKAIESSDITKLLDSWTKSTSTQTKVTISKSVGDEVDLHIEAIYENHKDLVPEEILPMQLEHMERALDNAIANNAYFITFIHGIGDGILKKAIFERLKHHKAVRSFENRFDPRYGFGATEVLLK